MRISKLIIAAVAILLFSLAFGSTVIFAAPGGVPAAHGVDGQTFGEIVSDMAQSDPGAVADHVRNN